LLLSVHKIFTKGPFGGLFRFRRRPLELSAPPGRGVPVLRHGIRASYQIGATQNGWCASLSRLTPLTPVVGQVRSARSGTHNSGLHDHAVILCSSWRCVSCHPEESRQDARGAFLPGRVLRRIVWRTAHRSRSLRRPVCVARDVRSLPRR